MSFIPTKKLGSKHFESLMNNIMADYYDEECQLREPYTDVFMIKAPKKGRLAPSGLRKWKLKHNKDLDPHHLTEIERRLLNTQYPLSIQFERLSVSSWVVKKANAIETVTVIHSFLLLLLLVFSMCLITAAHIKEFDPDEVHHFYSFFYCTFTMFMAGAVLLLCLLWRRFVLKEQAKIIYAEVMEKRQNQMEEVLEEYNQHELRGEGYEAVIGVNGSCFKLRPYQKQLEVIAEEVPVVSHPKKPLSNLGDHEDLSLQIGSLNSTFINDIDLDDYIEMGDDGAAVEM